MESLLHILELAKEKLIKKVFWPSSIAVFGPDSPRENTPQNCIMNPTSVYGISKLAGESWCDYYHEKFGVDVRSIRFPGILGYKSEPGGGTTDYAVWALKNAALRTTYESFLAEQTRLPMMHIEDAVESICELMRAPQSALTVRTSYNIASVNFTPGELEREIKKVFPEFKISYKPDFRQAIADSWPASIDDSIAKRDWGWTPQFDFSSLVKDIISGFQEKHIHETI